MNTHQALVSILADLAADLAGFALVVTGVWALVRGAGWLRSWDADRKAADRDSDDLRAFERRVLRSPAWPQPPVVPRLRMSKTLRDAITREATEQ